MAISLKYFMMPNQASVSGDYGVTTSGDGNITIPAGGTAILMIPFQFPRSGTATKGGTLQNVKVNYGVATNDLASITPVLQTVTYAPTATTATVVSTNAGFTLTAGADYTGTVTVTTPAIDNTATPRRYQLKLTVVAGADGPTTVNYYGTEANVDEVQA